MTDALLKFFDIGLGLALITKDTATTLVGELVQKGALSREQGQKILDEAGEKGERMREDLGERANQFFEGYIERFELVRKQDLAALESRVAALEARLASEEETGPSTS